jgi:hypothetical protein
MPSHEMSAKEIKYYLDTVLYNTLHETFIYIPETGQLINKKSGQVEGRINSNGYLMVYFNGRNYRIHRLVYCMFHGHLPKQQIDHINRIKTDNRIANLRDVPCIENTRNRGNGKTNKSGVKGVFWNRCNNRWQAIIRYKNKSVVVGSFKFFLNAVKARHYAEQKFGYLKDSVKSPAEKYLENAKQMKFYTNITFEEEKKVGKNSVSSEWEFFCYERKKYIDKLAEE